MKNYIFGKGESRWRKAAVLLATLLCLFLLPFFANVGDRYALNASAASDDIIEIQKYDVEMTVETDRKVYVKEAITVRFLTSYYNGERLTMFYRSLPTEGGRYYDFTASCPGNEAFYYNVKDNPDMGGFIDVNCVGGVEKNKVWTYYIEYAMESGQNSVDRMTIDVIPFGFTVPLHNVTATVRFPAAVATDAYAMYVGFGSTKADESIERELSADGKTLTFSTDLLEVRHNDRYDEDVADGVTLDFYLPDGTLESFAKTHVFTKDMWKIVLIGALCAGLAVAAYVLLHKKHEPITVVNIKAPDDMDPMKMGKLLDGVVDNEDVTSMIYYFAYKGYLAIDFEKQDDPRLIKRKEIADSETEHAKTLFEGLFDSEDSVYTSELQYRFCEKVDMATRQVAPVKMYEKKSVLGFFSGAILAVLLAVLVPFVMGRTNVGGGYNYVFGAALAVPVVGILVLAWIRENYRYKWKSGKRNAMLAAELVVAALGTLIFVGFFASHVMTTYEKIVLCLAVFGCTFATLGTLSRTEKYSDTLGEILGFKEFIVVTEEDKIKFMLEENPELYYKILPYAQVLGVTDEWEKKFAKILIEPPTWCTGTNMTVFDYWMINRCMRAAMVTAMMRPESKGGGSIGRSGGGGSFGGFGGGGFGGGGGGAR